MPLLLARRRVGLRRFVMRTDAFTLIELLVVIGLLALLIGFLLPTLSRIRSSAYESEIAGDAARYGNDAKAQAAAPELMRSAGPPRQAIRQARVSRFAAQIGLTPRLSVGTVQPESIYEATFTAKVRASAPVGADGKPIDDECEILLPLPPQIISLADLTVATDDGIAVSDDSLSMRDNRLVWRGRLAPSDGQTTLDFTYSAVGRGLYELQTPPGDVVDQFQIDLTANGSDVRMLELSLQPTALAHASGRTTYTWNYKRLMFGRPIALDVLGIAPLDRLGELRWLGPLSVVVFGMLVGLVAKSYHVDRFDRWSLLLVVGTFTAAYPLMYFAQEFIPLTTAVLSAAGVAMLIVGWRAVTVMPIRLALFGIFIPGALVMAVTLGAALRPQLQGLLLTGEAMAFFVLAMVLMPRTETQLPPANLATA